MSSFGQRNMRTDPKIHANPNLLLKSNNFINDLIPSISTSAVLFKYFRAYFPQKVNSVTFDTYSIGIRLIGLSQLDSSLYLMTLVEFSPRQELITICKRIIKLIEDLINFMVTHRQLTFHCRPCICRTNN